MELKNNIRSVGQNSYHLVWKPKWSKDPFKFKPVLIVCEASIKNVAKRTGMNIFEMEIMPDHIHLFVDIPPTMSVSNALQLLKGFSAKKIFEHHPWLRRHFRTGHFWSPGKFFRSVGNVSAEAIQNYIAGTNRTAKFQKLLTGYPAL
ncbi:IS200/IS605 family transposase [Candidatus Woesearchaeota archaeon]|nr:IS200/IS605 family transposase [Candidatus Woesearchaeota archaeon]